MHSLAQTSQARRAASAPHWPKALRGIGRARLRLNVIDRLFPGVCVLCRRRSGRDIGLCIECEQACAINSEACPRCAEPLAAAASDSAGGADEPLCGTCLSSPPPWQRTVAPFTYTPPLSRILSSLKTGNGLLEARILGALLAPCVRERYAGEPLPAALVPMPMTRRRRWRRGFNQAELLAAVVARALDLPHVRSCLVRTKDAPPQRSLSRSARLRNVRGAFEVKRPLPGRHVALVDDVTTTGATVRAAAAALRRGGAGRVDVWTVAKTPAHSLS